MGSNSNSNRIFCSDSNNHTDESCYADCASPFCSTKKKKPFLLVFSIDFTKCNRMAHSIAHCGQTGDVNVEWVTFNIHSATGFTTLLDALILM